MPPVDVTVTQVGGSVQTRRLPSDTKVLELFSQQVQQVSDTVAQLTRVVSVNLFGNALTAVPPSFYKLTQMTWLNVRAPPRRIVT